MTYDFGISLYQGEEELGSSELQFSEVFAIGHPVVLNPWAGLCPTCRAELPELQEVYDKFGDQVVFLGVDIGPFTGLGREPEGRALLAELGITFPAGGTQDNAILREYRVLGVPEVLFFSANGELVDRFGGLLTAQQFAQRITALIG